MSYWDNLSHAARQIIPLDRPTYEIIGPFSIFGDFQQGMRFALVTGGNRKRRQVLRVSYKRMAS